MDDHPSETKRSLPAELHASDVVAVIDTGEQLPFDLSPLRTVPGTLAVGDYSVRGLESQIAIKRKTLAELVCCCGSDRRWFEQTLSSMLAYPCRAVIVETSWAELEEGDWRYAMKPAAVVSSVLGWMAIGVPFVLAGDRRRSQQLCSTMLTIVARRRWRELRALAQNSETWG